MKTQILIYSTFYSARLEYIACFIFEEILGLTFKLTSSLHEFSSFVGPKINYSREEIIAAIKIIPTGLLSEKGVSKQIIGIGSWQSIPAFFITSHSEDINFDIFSAAFYMISRYEEYLQFPTDIHGRFQASSSLAFRNNFLEVPVVDQWIQKLGEVLTKKYPGLTLPSKKFDWISSIDVDTAWAFLNRNFINTSLSILKSFFTSKDFFKRIRILQGKENDPFYTFDFLKEIHSGDPDKLIFFFLAGKPGGFDRNIDPTNKNWQGLVKDISSVFKTGLHPSYRSFRNSGLLKLEIKKLSSLISGPVIFSRQHFLLLRFPETYRNLIESGIENDFTMGFSDHTGFRAGTANVFNFYDLEKEERTGLRIWPFVVMDRTLKNYMKLNQEQSHQKIVTLLDSIAHTGGIFISLWHNDSISDSGEWKGWKNVYMDMIYYLKNKI